MLQKYVKTLKNFFNDWIYPRFEDWSLENLTCDSFFFFLLLFYWTLGLDENSKHLLFEVQQNGERKLHKLQKDLKVSGRGILKLIVDSVMRKIFQCLYKLW